MANKDTFRIVTRGSDGSLLIRDYPNLRSDFWKRTYK